jgi:predicted 3-demethylubiquinone-9 3-methyltransferase (glyoxalase superfamily)
MTTVHRISPCLWFDNQAEDAAKFYVSIFKNAKLGSVSHYPSEGQEIHGKGEGKVLVAEFEIDGQKFMALNGGPQFKFTEAVSFFINCDSQAEIDSYWSKLTADGGEEGPCGWLKDKFGLSWQVGPANISQWLTDPDKTRSARVFKAVMQMKKLDLGVLEKAYAG